MDHPQVSTGNLSEIPAGFAPVALDHIIPMGHTRSQFHNFTVTCKYYLWVICDKLYLTKTDYILPKYSMANIFSYLSVFEKAQECPKWCSSESRGLVIHQWLCQTLHIVDTKGVLALECWTGGRLVSPAYGWEKNNWTPL